jgi:hypothetical protein
MKYYYKVKDKYVNHISCSAKWTRFDGTIEPPFVCIRCTKNIHSVTNYDSFHGFFNSKEEAFDQLSKIKNIFPQDIKKDKKYEKFLNIEIVEIDENTIKNTIVFNKKVRCMELREVINDKAYSENCSVCGLNIPQNIKHVKLYFPKLMGGKLWNSCNLTICLMCIEKLYKMEETNIKEISPIYKKEYDKKFTAHLFEQKIKLSTHPKWNF